VSTKDFADAIVNREMESAVEICTITGKIPHWENPSHSPTRVANEFNSQDVLQQDKVAVLLRLDIHQTNIILGVDLED